MDTTGLSEFASYGISGIAVLQLGVLVWIINGHSKNIDNRDAKIDGLSKSALLVVEANNKIVSNHINHNTEQMKEICDVTGELRDAVNRLVGYLKNSR